jgi:hypothetical protein
VTHASWALQQPWEQYVAVQLQVPFFAPLGSGSLHSLPAAQAEHAMPPVPHLASVWLAKSTHVLPSQHPSLQVVPSQVQTP